MEFNTQNRGKWLLAVFLFIFFLSTSAQATDYYVKAGGDDSKDGDTWITAFEHIGEALLNAASGESDTIHVAAGTYTENIKLRGGVSILGGYPPNPTNGDARNTELYHTIIDGSGTGPGSSHKTAVVSALGASGTLDGFTIQNGNGKYGGGIEINESSLRVTNNYITANNAKVGGGIYARNLNGGLIESNTVVDNYSSWHGGGMHLTRLNGTIRNNTIQNNIARAAGGAIYLSESTKENGAIEGNFVENNVSGKNGGAFYIDGSATTLSRNYITANYTHSAGGGMYLNDYSGTIVNCMVTDNHAQKGGAIYAALSNEKVVFINDTIASNTSDGIAPGILSYNNNLTFINSIIWHDSYDFYGSGGTILVTIFDEDVEYEAIQSVPLVITISDSNVSDSRYENPGYNVISEYPKFIGGGDYHLGPDSPCANSGTDAGAPNFDIDGDSRPYPADLPKDMGADEYTGDIICSDGDGDKYFAQAGCGTFVDCDDSDSTINPGVSDLCDGVDNDCDHFVDEDYQTSEIICGKGACASTGSISCVDGQEINSCSPGEPATEVCDGIDNDCNGAVDDGLGTSTCGFGACEITVDNCVNGESNTCEPLVDTTAPNLTIPGDVTVEQATPQGNVVPLTATVSDTCDPNVDIVDTTLAIYPQGSTTVTFTATDASGNSTIKSMTVTVVDTTAPDLTIPGDVTVEQATPQGNVVPLTATATDNGDGNVDIVDTTLAVYPQGSTTVTFTATDASGNSTAKSMTVTVVDTTAPNLTIPGDVIVEQATLQGTVVPLIATVSDNGDGNVDIVDTTLAVYPQGSTTVTFTATDASGNSTIKSMTVTVVDTTAPELTIPADVIVEQATLQGSVVPLTATATDDGDDIVDIVDNTLDIYPQGSTTVTFTASDDSGNSTTKSMTVTVADTTQPDIDLVVEPSELWPPNHTLVKVTTVSSADIGDSDLEVDISVSHNEIEESSDWQIDADGSVWVRAERDDSRIYTITVTSTDDSGNVSTATATVTVPHGQGNDGYAEEPVKGNKGTK